MTAPGIAPLLAGQTGAVDAITYAGVTPDLSDWLPDLLQELLPTTADVVRDELTNYDPFAILDERPRQFVEHVLLSEDVGLATDDHHDRAGADALAGSYAHALTTYVTKFSFQDGSYVTDPADADLTEIQESIYRSCIDLCTNFDNEPGPGPFHAGVDDLKDGPLAIHRELDERTRTLRLRFDATAWADLDDARSGRLALTALSRLADVFRVELVLSSPNLIRALRRVDEDWLDAQLDFTEPRNDSPSTATPSVDEDVREVALTALADYDDGDGHLRILKALQDGARQQRELIADPDVDLSESGVSRYVGDLEAQGLVQVDTSGTTNTVQLTSAGDLAATEYITADHDVLDPSQATLDARFTPALQSASSAVYRAQRTREGGEMVRSAEDWLADTGDPSTADADYNQWLAGPTAHLDNWAMHNRITAAVRGPGVTLVDDRLQAFDDSRVTYTSCFSDELLAIVQYGGPLRTMGRLVGALLGNRALSKVLGPSTVGDDLDGFLQDAREELEADLDDVLKWGHQIDARFFDEDSVHDYTDFNEKVRKVRSFCLKKVGELAGSDDYGARGELLRDLHGLVTSATHLYHAVDVDVVINIRVPKMRGWDDLDERDFLDFMETLVEKQTVYKHHSGHRMLIENRKEKLQMRLPYSEDLDEDDLAMETTADFLVDGPAMLEYFDDVRAALQSNQHRLRESVADGVEQTAIMEIPVHNGSSFLAIRELVEKVAARKGYQTASEADLEFSSEQRHSIERLARLLLRSFNTEDRPHRASPHDVAEALTRMAQSSRTVDWLTLADVEAGLARMSPERLFPELPVTMTQMIQAMVASDGPIGRSALLEQTGISASSYDRHIKEVSALDVVERCEVNGRTAYSGHLEPWWAPQSTRSDPHDRRQQFDEDVPGGALQGPVDALDLFGELYFNLDEVYDAVDDDLLRYPYDEPIADASPIFGRWFAFIWPIFATREQLENGPPDAGGEPTVATVRIGALPSGLSDEQTGLDETSSHLETGASVSLEELKMADGGREGLQ